MITLRTFRGPVYLISENGIDIQPNVSDTKLKKYEGPSNSILIEVFEEDGDPRNNRLEIVIGKDVTPSLFKSVLGFAFLQRKRIVIRSSELLSNLYEIDKMISVANSFLEPSENP